MRAMIDRIVVGITGASGAAYARRVMQLLAEAGVEIHLTVSTMGRRLLFEELVRATIFPDAARLIAEHHASGHVVAIVSGATRYIVKPGAEYLGVAHMLYTRLEVEDGVLTGRVHEPLCFDEGKIYWVQQFIEDEAVDLARSYFYTDSVTDLPLLELVGHPVVTNPDPILYRTAVRRRWPVRFFEPPQDDARKAS